MNSIPAPRRKAGRCLGLTYIIAGAVCLFDPYIGIFDVLPDCIGYLFFALGLIRLADLDDRLSDARRGALRLALLGVARLVAVFLTFGLVSPTERPAFMLLVLFSLGVLDILCVIPLWKQIGDGLLHLGNRTEATAVFDRARRGGQPPYARSLTERYVGFSAIYFCLREILVVLPEMTVLTHEAGGNDWSLDSLYNFVGFFRVTGYVVSFILGLVWLCKTVRYIGRLKKDTPFIEGLRRKYESEVLSRRELFAMRAIKSALIALAGASILTLDFYIEGVTVLPDFLVAVALLLTLGFLRHYEGTNRPAILAAVLYGVAAVSTWFLQLTYFDYADIADVLRDPALIDRLNMTVIVQAVTALLFLVAFGLTLLAIYRMAKRHTGLHALHEGSTYSAERTEAIHRRIRKKLLIVGICAVLSALSVIIQWAVIPYLEPLDFIGRPSTGDALISMLYDLLREAYWSVDLILGGALVAATIHAGSEIFDQMDYSYLMNESRENSPA